MGAKAQRGTRQEQVQELHGGAARRVSAAPAQTQAGAVRRWGGRAQRRSRLFFKKTPRQLDRVEKRAIIRGSAANNAVSRQSGSGPCGESRALELKNRVVQTVWVA